MCQVNVLEVYSSSLLLSLQTLLIIKAMALSNSIDSSMNKSQVVVGKTKSEFRQIYLAYPDILIEAWHPLYETQETLFWEILWRTLQTHDADMLVIKIPQNSFLYFIFLKKIMFYYMSQWVIWSVCLYIEMPFWWKM